MKKAILILLITFLASCSGGLNGKVMNNIMDSWKGSHIDEAINQWGVPDAEQKMAGRRFFVWDKNMTWTAPSTTTGTGTVVGNTVSIITNTTGGGTSNWNCRRVLLVNDENIITSWQWSGNNCPFAAVGPYASWPKKD